LRKLDVEGSGSSLPPRLVFFVSTFLAFGFDGECAGDARHLPPSGMMPRERQSLDKRASAAHTHPNRHLMTGFYASNNPLAAIRGAAESSVTFGVAGLHPLRKRRQHRSARLRDETGWEARHVCDLAAPHGVSEIQGFFVAVGAGFVLGWALINPGRRRRGEALAEAGKDAIVLIATSIVMMFIAAPFRRLREL